MAARLAAVVCLGALILCVPVALNGGPLLYFDSSNYLSRGEAALQILAAKAGVELSSAPGIPARQYAPSEPSGDGRVYGGRSVYYSVFAYLGLWLSGLRAVVAVQALAMSWVVVLLFRLAGPADWAASALAAIGTVSLLSPASLFVGLIMPDVWAGLAVLASAILLFCWRGLAHGEKAGLLAILLFALIAHNSHLALVCVLLAAAGAAATAVRSLRRRMARPAFGAVGLCVLAAVGANAAFGLVVQSVTGAPPIARPFLSAHLADAGPAASVLDDLCDGEDAFALCAYRDRLPMEWRAFLFDPDPETGVFGAAPVEVQRALASEQMAFALATLRAAPLETIGMFVGDGLRQIGLFAVDGVPMTPARDYYLETRFPESLVEMTRGSLLYRHTAILSGITVASYAGCLAGLLLLAWTLPAGPGALLSGGAERAQLRGALIAFCASGVLLNALICGALASPYDRFQARIIWIVPLFATLALLSARHRLRLPFPSQGNQGKGASDDVCSPDPPLRHLP